MVATPGAGAGDTGVEMSGQPIDEATRAALALVDAARAEAAGGPALPPPGEAGAATVGPVKDELEVASEGGLEEPAQAEAVGPVEGGSPTEAGSAEGGSAVRRSRSKAHPLDRGIDASATSSAPHPPGQ